jgi:hypothetical protein
MESDIESVNEIETSVEGFELDEWSKYILARRQQYFSERASIIGPEYDINRKGWDIIIEREWSVMEERLRGGIGVETEIVSQFGIDFFANQEAIVNEIMEMISDLPTRVIGRGETERVLRIYTFEDYLMLSNQGIFRDEQFILDPQSRWKKKVAETLIQYGFVPSETIMIEGVRHYVITRAE